MVSQLPVRRKPKSRGLPPGQKLLLALGLVGICGVATSYVLRPHANNAQQPLPQTAVQAPQAVARAATPFPLTQPMGDLTNQILGRANQPNLSAGVFIVEPSTGRFVDINARRAYSAASMIKLPILVRLLQAVDAGTVKFDQNLTLRQELIGGGSGWLQWRKPGTQYTVEETARLMMNFSDNTATNMIIDLLGGKEVLNADFPKWGLQYTKVNDWLPDLPGTNTTSPYDLAFLLGRVDKGELLSGSSRAWLLETLKHNRTRTLLPRGLPAGTIVSDKTGDIGKLVGDAGIITTATGNHYIVTVAVERPFNDRRANALIRRISKDAYIGITGDTAGAAKVVVDDEQKAAPKRSSKAPRHRRHRHR